MWNVAEGTEKKRVVKRSRRASAPASSSSPPPHDIHESLWNDNKHQQRNTKKPPWYKTYRSSLAIALFVVAGNAIALPIFRRMSSIETPVVPVDPVLVLVDPVVVDPIVPVIAVSLSLPMLFVMLLATIVWVLAAWKFLRKKYNW